MLVLLKVDASYRAAFAGWASRQSIAFAHVEADAEAETLAAPPALLVVQASQDRDVSPPRLRLLEKIARGAPIVVLAGPLHVDSVVAALRHGVSDVLGLPADPIDVVARSMRHWASPSATEPLEVVGHAPAIARARKEAATVARMRSLVLIAGEPGTGKADLAHLIHRLSSASSLPFVHVDGEALASDPATELFGTTSSRAPAVGAVERAGRGTLYLEGVDVLGAEAQRLLLALLRERSFRQPESGARVPLAARLIVGSHRDLREEVRQRRFRSDLYYRLNAFELKLPPLRERLEDLPLLVRHHADRIARRHSIAPPEIQDAFHAALSEHDWPGNVRELVGLIERWMVSAPGRPLDEACVREVFGTPEASASPDASEAVEGDRISRVLVATGGNVARAARRLGIPRSTLRYRIQRHGLERLIPGD